MNDSQGRDRGNTVGRLIARHATFSMSTDDVSQKDSFEYWESACRDAVGLFEFQDYERKDFRAGLTMLPLDSLKICHFFGSAHAMERRKPHLRSSDTDAYNIILGSRRTWNFAQGRYHEAVSGGISLIDNTQAYVGAHPEGLDVVSVFVPRAALDRALGPSRLAVGSTISAAQASYPIIATYLQTLVEHGALLDPARQARMASVAVELIAAGFAERLEANPPKSLSGAAILTRAQAFIADHIGVEGLSISDVATALNISVRRLQEVASAQGIALMDWMWERRLQLAQAKLSDAAHGAMPVGLIAYQCGFVSQAHFSRRFKERFGQTPTEFKVWAGLLRGGVERRP